MPPTLLAISNNDVSLIWGTYYNVVSSNYIVYNVIYGVGAFYTNENKNSS